MANLYQKREGEGCAKNAVFVKWFSKGFLLLGGKESTSLSKTFSPKEILVHTVSLTHKPTLTCHVVEYSVDTK